MSMKKRRRKTEEEKKETVMKIILENTLAMALMAVMEVRTMIMNAKTVRKIKREIIQRCR